MDTRGGNPSGWVYLSGEEAEEGGIGVLTFNAEGELIDYAMILTNTSNNNNGGRTPWDTWISGERDINTLNGEILQVDPFGVRDAENITMSEGGGAWEGTWSLYCVLACV